MHHNRTHWKSIEKQSNFKTKTQNYQLPTYKTITEAALALSKFFGLTAIEGTEKVELGSSMHEMKLGGEVKGKGEVLAIVKIKMHQELGCVLNLQVKTTDPETCQLIIESLQ